ncbi:MAG: S1C family serine protease [Thermoguttaceae bacterium]
MPRAGLVRRRDVLNGVVAAALGAAVLAAGVPPGRARAQPPDPPQAQRQEAPSLQQRADLYRQLRREAEFLQKKAAVLKTVAKLLGPSVVHIQADVARRPALQIGGPHRQVEENGSGVIIQWGEKFYVLTNRHVLGGAAPSAIKIDLADGRRIQPEKVWDDRETDVAVLAVSAPDLVAAELGNSDELEMGDFVLAVGCPFGLDHSVSFGIISGKGRRNLQLGAAGIRLQDFLQTDAAINPGNSGGPLVNLAGEVIGINTCIASSSGGSEGVGFAIPINMFMHVARQLIEQGRVKRAYLGVTLDDKFGPAMAAELGLARARGALVVQVTPQSPAAAARIREKDVILAFDHTPVDSDGHLMNLVSLTPIGKTVPVVIFRDRQTITLEVTVADRDKF